MSENPWAMLYEISVRSSLILFKNALLYEKSVNLAGRMENI